MDDGRGPVSPMHRSWCFRGHSESDLPPLKESTLGARILAFGPNCALASALQHSEVP